MTRLRIGWRAGVLCLLGAAAAMAGGALSQSPASRPQAPPAAPPAPGSDERVEVPPPPFTDGIFPCSSCYAGMPVNRARRELTEFHTDIVLAHEDQHLGGGGGISIGSPYRT